MRTDVFQLFEPPFNIDAASVPQLFDIIDESNAIGIGYVVERKRGEHSTSLFVYIYYLFIFNL